MIIKFLFPQKLSAKKTSILLLAARIVFGIMFMTHGIAKWNSFDTLAATFPDPLGVGSSVSLSLAIFGELACSLAFILGILYRLSVIPMIFTMIVAFFIVHGGAPFAARELAFLYMVVFVFMYLMGPGIYSVDYYIGKHIRNRKKTIRFS